MKQNTWLAKINRTFTSVLPSSKKAKGKCLNCGECCRLPNICPFLEFKSDNKAYCSIYPIRPLNCRKYPRNEFEFLTKYVCGFKFE